MQSHGVLDQLSCGVSDQLLCGSYRQLRSSRHSVCSCWQVHCLVMKALWRCSGIDLMMSSAERVPGFQFWEQSTVGHDARQLRQPSCMHACNADAASIICHLCPHENPTYVYVPDIWGYLEAEG
jgi:hypothetical protein